MKVINRDILPFQENNFFFPIRDKIDYARLIAYSTRNLLLEYDAGNIVTNGKMKLIIDRMSRLFFYKDNKFFSVSFPFLVQSRGHKVIEINSFKGREVNNKSISDIVSILEDEQFKLNPSLIDFYIESNNLSANGFSLLEEIFQFEPTYIRFDIDPTNENGKLHPLFHLDINYSSYGTYKLGLNNAIVGDYFENLLNITTDCSFITD